MRQLSHADRAAILNIVDQLGSADGHPPDPQIIRQASDVLLNSRLRTGFEHVLARDTVFLCNHLRTAEDEEVRRTARAALIYLVRRDDYWPDSSPEVGFQDDAYVLALALHEIQKVTGDATIYDAPGLTETEKKAADAKLEHFIAHPLCSDGELVARAAAFGHSVSMISTGGFFGRMCKHVSFLSSELSANCSKDNRAWARAALSYLAAPDDVIPDALGILGYVDDWYVLDTVAGMLKPNDPWPSLLNETVRRWPFLNWLILGENGSRLPLSEYMIANAALTMQQLQPEHKRSLSGIILPAAGPIPVLAAFTAGLGLTHLAAQSSPALLSFEVGQKVIVDGKAVAVFGGFHVIDGKRMFKLVQHRTHKGRRSEPARYWPEEHLSRLRPADEDRSVRGRIVFGSAQNQVAISAVDRLLYSETPIQFTDSASRIILVSPLGECHNITSELTVFGEKLHEVIPWGHIDSRGDVESWSGRWGTTQPVVVVASSLDKAREYLDELESQPFSMMIVHGRGALSRQAVSLRRLCRAELPLCVFSRGRDREDLELLDSAGGELFEWEPEDICELTWRNGQDGSHRSGIRSHEHRIVAAATSRPEVRKMALPSATAVFDLLRTLRRLSAQRQGELHELSAFLARSQGLMCRLMQTVVPLAECAATRKEIATSLHELKAVVCSTLYLSPDERELCEAVTNAFEDLVDALHEENPKASAIADLLRRKSELILICHDAFVAQRSTAYWEKQSQHGFLAVPCPTDSEELLSARVVVSGWLGSSRMPVLLQPPISDKMTLLLYEVECKWHAGFKRANEKARKHRQTRSKRESFLGPAGKRDPGEPGPGETQSEDDAYNELSALDQITSDYHRQHAIDRARAVGGDEPEVEAKVFWFMGGSYAFLTDLYKAKSVTHLLDGSLSNERVDKAGVRLVPRGEVSIGDRLLFYRGADGDAIRAVADQLLSPGRRQVAGLWRDALRRFRDRYCLKNVGVWRKLKEAGCTHQPLTINNWLEDDDMIGPRDAHDHELRIIADVTQDRQLIARMQECDEAIRDVWGAHLAASDRLAKLVLTRMARRLAVRGESVTELDASVVVVEVAEIDNTPVKVRRSLSNRLLED